MDILPQVPDEYRDEIARMTEKVAGVEENSDSGGMEINMIPDINNICSMIDVLQYRAASHPERIAFQFLIDGEIEGNFITFGELDRQARSIASLLQQSAKAGDRILLMYPPGLEFISAFFGCLYSSGIAVPIYPPRFNRSLERLQSVISDAQTALTLTVSSVYANAEKKFDNTDELKRMNWIVTDTIIENYEETWKKPAADQDTIAFLQYTSGSTATPKGVMVSHGNLLHNEHVIQQAYGHNEKSTYVSWLPLFHDMGLIGNVLQCIYVGSKCILMAPTAFLQKPYRWLQTVSKYRAHTSGGPNFAYDLCTKSITEEQKSLLDLSSWTAAFNGSEPVRNLSLDHFSEAFASCGFKREAFYPCYGLAEATLFVTGGSMQEAPKTITVDETALSQNNVEVNPVSSKEDKTLVGCGHSWTGHKVIIAAPETMTPCPPDRVGEIWAAGPSIARGYWGNDEETAKTFQAYLKDSGEGPFMRTGDLGFIRENELYVTGRLKDLIIIHGYNHYPQDIEATVEGCHEALRPGYGAAFSIDMEGEERLVIVQEVERQYRNSNLDSVIDTVIKSVLEVHELKIHAIILIMPGSVPKTSSGKIQRRRCRMDYLADKLDIVKEWKEPPVSKYSGNTVGTTCNDILTQLAFIISRRLNAELSQIDFDRPVIYYGIDSLKAVELSHDIENSLGVEIPMSDFFGEFSIKELALVLNDKLLNRQSIPKNKTHTENEKLSWMPLSRGQKALWLLYLLQPDSTAYNISRAVRLFGEVNVEALIYAFQALTYRHAALRTFFSIRDGEPVQTILHKVDVNVAIVDASNWSEEIIKSRLDAESSKPFNLEEGPPFRVIIFEKACGENILFISLHHIITDFWSLAIMLKELGQLYTAKIQLREAELPAPGLEYFDYVKWQEEILAGSDGKRLEKYWKDQLSGELPVINLPTDRSRPPVQTYKGGMVDFEISGENLVNLEKLAAKEGASLYMVLLAAFQVLLHRYSGQDDILIGSPSACREKARFSNIVGYFTNPLVICSRNIRGKTFIELLADTKSTVLNAYRNQNYPFAELVSHLQPERDPSRSPVFQVMFTFQKAQIADAAGLNAAALDVPGIRMRFGELEFETMETGYYSAQFDLALSVTESVRGLAATIGYNAGLYYKDTIRRMVGHYINILYDIANNPSKKIMQIGLLSSDEREQLLNFWNNTTLEYPEGMLIHELFELQAEYKKDKVAAIFNDERITYGELNQRADRLASKLRNFGVRRETIVAIYMERSLELLVGLLAILKAGGTYLPVDTIYPDERIKYMMEDAKPLLVLTQSSLKASAKKFGVRMLVVDEKYDALGSEVIMEHAGRKSSEEKAGTTGEFALNNMINTNKSGADCLAYIIYTSGSAGKPKGVKITHGSVVNFLFSMRFEPGFTDSDVLLAVTTISFDIAVLEIFLPLSCGGQVVISSREAASDGVRLMEMMNRFGVTVMQATPVTWQLMLEAGWKRKKDLKILCGGEVLSRELAGKLLDAGDSLWNMYGPTETTVWSATGRVHSGEGPVTVGKPIGNTRIYILDSNLQPVPVGVTGELLIGGRGLAQGYVNQPLLTSSKFIPDPFDVAGKGRLYRTGDLARYRPDGSIEILGRTDNQVKIRGFRIELEDIEASINMHTSVNNSVVTAWEASPDDKRLVAYYTYNNGHKAEGEELRRYLKGKLPDYMIPSIFIPLDQIPLTPNGKVNRKALPAPNPSSVRMNIVNNAHAVNELEKIIEGIWKEVLNIGDVGIDSRFFDIGGHSLLMVRVFNKLRDTLDTEIVRSLSMVDLFRYPTIRSLADFLTSKQAKAYGNVQLDDKGAHADKVLEKSRIGKDMYSGGIAIIGMACRFPGASNVDEFWSNLVDGAESISFFNREELIDAGLDPVIIDNQNYVKARGIISDSERFDTVFFGYSPREAEMLDPQHRVFLECAWGALEDAGCNTDIYKGRIGLYASTGMNHYLLKAFSSNAFSDSDFTDTSVNYQMFTGNDKDFVSTRVSYKLNLKGPSVNVQTACSSSLVAVHMACRSIRDGECDMALAGGVSIKTPQKEGYMYQQGGIPSQDGHCRAFDEKAGGTVFGNGAGIVVLKPVEQAISDGDNIYAVIKASAVNNDGSSKVGYTAPSVEGQAEVIRCALENAGIVPGMISYIEAHGTGTELGDPIEIEALKEAFGKCDKEGFCGIGSVKSNIGHLDTASGIAGLIKTALALKNGLIPPTLNFNRPNPKLGLDGSPFSINDRLMEWKSEKLPRMAGVSSFGIGGTNVHAILEEAPNMPDSSLPRPWQLLTISTQTKNTYKTTEKNLAYYLSCNPSLSLPDIAYTLAIGRKAMNYRRVALCRSTEDIVRLLEKSDDASETDNPGDTGNLEKNGEESRAGIGWIGGGWCDTRPGKVVFMFPGQGSQYSGMARGLYENESVFRDTVNICAKILKERTGIDIIDIIYSLGENTAEADEKLKNTSLAQPALFIIEYALALLWMQWGIRPWAMIGHSIGEYTAACISGVFTVEEALLLVAERGRLMQGIPNGTMIAVPLQSEKLKEYISQNEKFSDISIAAINAPAICTVSGSVGAVEEFMGFLAGNGIEYSRLHTSKAFHSKMMDNILQQFRERVSKVKMKPPVIPFISNITGTWIKQGEVTDPDYWVRQLRQTVLFSDGIKTLSSEEGCILLEAGPGKTLCTLAKQVVGNKSGLRVYPSVRHPLEKHNDTAFILGTLGKLWLDGVDIDWQHFYEGEKRRKVSLPTYPFEGKNYSLDFSKKRSGDLTKKALIDAEPDRYYIPSWRKSMPPYVDPSLADENEKTCQLVFCDESGIGGQIALQLAAIGYKVVSVKAGEAYLRLNDSSLMFEVKPGNKNDFQTLFDDISSEGLMPDQIFYFWGVGGGKHIDGNWENDVYFHSLVYIGQLLGKYKMKIAEKLKTEIIVITNDLWRVESSDSISDIKSLILGPVRVIPLEYPDLLCRNVDVRFPEKNSDAYECLLNQLVVEILSRSEDNVVSYRGSDRWVQIYEKVRMDIKERRHINVRENGTYLITGGLGGIGLKLAAYLSEKAKVRLILTGRKPFPDRKDWEGIISDPNENSSVKGKIRTIIDMEKHGTYVEVCRADVTDIEQMKRVVEKACRLNGTIDGVIHAAGVSGGGLIARKTAEDVERVLLPKVKGTLTLFQAIENIKPDFFMMCSSVTSITGAFGQIDYTSANAFLNAFAQKHARENGIFHISVCWNRWKGIGMAANLSKDAEHIHPLLDRCISSDGDRSVYVTEFSADTHWVLSEHMVANMPTIPGAAYIEMARAAFENQAGGGSIEIRDVVFMTPFSLKPGEARKACTSINYIGGSYEFKVTSINAYSEKNSGNIQEHARGMIGHMAAERGIADPSKYDLEALLSRCCLVKERTAAVESGHLGLIRTGPRWASLTKLYTGRDEVLAMLELPSGYMSDLEGMMLHPALLDIATGLLQHLLRQGNYLPLAYESVSIYKPMAGRMYGYVTMNRNDHEAGLVSCNVKIMDEHGNVLMEVEKFTMRRVNQNAIVSLNTIAYGSESEYAYEYAAAVAESADRQYGSLLLTVGNDAKLDEYSLTAEDGVAAFDRIFAACTLPQVIVSTRDLNTVIKETNLSSESEVLIGLKTANSVKPTHERPDIGNEYTAPENETEQVISRIWQQVLGIDLVGVNDNFFELGGTSLTGIQVVSELKKALGVEISTVSIFEAPTVKLLAGLLNPDGDRRLSDKAKERAERKKEAIAGYTGIQRREKVVIHGIQRGQ